MNIKKFAAKDLITIGLYTVLLFIVQSIIIVIASPLMAFAPPLTPAIGMFFGGIVYMLMALRVSKRGTLLLMGTLTGIFFALMGTPIILPYCILTAFIVELTLLKGNGSQYKNRHRQAIAYGIYGAFFSIGSYMTIYLLGSSQLEKMRYSKEAIDELIYFAYSPIWMTIGLIGGFILSLSGCYFATKLLQKHFVKAGYLYMKK